MTHKKPSSRVEKICQFIRDWWASDTIDEACQRTGMDRRDASNLAAHLRRKGVPMKNMPRAARNEVQPMLTNDDLDLLRFVGKQERDKHEPPAPANPTAPTIWPDAVRTADAVPELRGGVAPGATSDPLVHY